MKVQPVLKGKFWELGGAGWSVGCQSIRPVAGHSLARICPFGQPGDRLWVRETLHYDCEQGHYYAASGKHGETVYLSSLFDDDATQIGPSYDGLLPERSVPSIHLHRQYSRILLEVTDVRVERLQDITEEQAQAEGCFFTDYGRDCFHNGGRIGEVGNCPAPESSHPRRNGWMWEKTNSHEQCLLTARFAFSNLWEKTGGDWDANPWVWAIEFKRIQP